MNAGNGEASRDLDDIRDTFQVRWRIVFKREQIFGFDGVRSVSNGESNGAILFAWVDWKVFIFVGFLVKRCQ